METRYVFVDSSIFIGQNYNYTGPALESLLQLAKSGQACLLVTDIVVREVRTHIAEDVARARQASSKFRSDARILRNLGGKPYEHMFGEIVEEDAIAVLNSQLDDFLAGTNATILETAGVSVERVFDKYFHREPPFGDGKKKSEFPDAFTAEALKAWCIVSGEKVYVVSTDPDLGAVCDGSEYLLALKKLPEFVNIIQYHDDVLAPGVQEKLRNNTEVIAQAIADSFCDVGFWLDDQEGDVHEVKVEDVKIEEFLVLKVSGDSATVDIPIRIKYSASVTYDDMDTASYDSKEKVLIPWHTIQTALEKDERFETVLTIRHSVDDNDIFEVEEVVFTLGSPYGIALTVEDPWDCR